MSVTPIPGGNMANLSRAGGRPYTDKPRVYVGCLPCGLGRYVSSVRWANVWLERHWKKCPRTSELAARARSDAGVTPQKPREALSGVRGRPA